MPFKIMDLTRIHLGKSNNVDKTDEDPTWWPQFIASSHVLDVTILP